MSYWIHRWDTKLRFMTKFGENRPLQTSWKVAWFTKKTTLRDSSQSPFCPKWVDRAQNPMNVVIYWPVHVLCTPNLVWIGCILPDLFRKNCIFGPNSLYNIGFQPTIKYRYFRSMWFGMVLIIDSTITANLDGLLLATEVHVITVCHPNLLYWVWKRRN